MTVSTTTRKASFSCNGITTAFDFSFPINAEEDMTVIIRDADGVETTLTATTDYEVSGENNSFANGGTVTTVTYASGSRALYAWPSGNTILLARVTPKTQATKYVDNQKFSQAGLMNDIDKLCMMVQELKEQVDRSLAAPISDSGTDFELPNETDRAGAYLGFAPDGSPIAAADPTLTPTTAYTAALLAAGSLAAFIAAMGADADIVSELGLDTDLLTFSLPASTTISAFAKTLLDDVDAATARATLAALGSGDGTVNALTEKTVPVPDDMMLLEDSAASYEQKKAKIGALAAVPGTVIAWPTGSVPTGWLECDGSSVSKTTYATLYNVLKQGGSSCIYGESTTFNLPDYRGRFLRGWAHGQTTDPDKSSRTNRGDGTTGDYVGTKQADEFKSHTHTWSPYYLLWETPNGEAGNWYRPAANWISDNDGGEFFALANSGGNETRPININVMWIIRY